MKKDQRFIDAYKRAKYFVLKEDNFDKALKTSIFSL